MDELIDKIWNITIEKILEIEKNDPQFIALKNLYNNLENKELFLSLIIINSLICYQLSSTWEKYWQEFSDFFSKNQDINFENLEKKFIFFLKNSKWNKRLFETKKNRVKKIIFFIEEFYSKQDFFYNNFEKLLNFLSKNMNQKPIAKTIVFSVKMFWYGWRIFFDKINLFPANILIPIDSRLERIYKKYNNNLDLEIKDFYISLSKKLNISMLHLDSLLWTKKDLV